MRLTDEQIIATWRREWGVDVTFYDRIVATVRSCLALAAQPDKPSDYADVERRGFEVSQPGELPR